MGYTRGASKKGPTNLLQAEPYVKEEEILIFITKGGNLSSGISHTHIYY